MAFVVFSLPRSRSAWMAHYLGSAGDLVGHDIGIECKHPEDFLASFRNGMAGTCETGSMFGWRLLRHFMPQVKFVVVRRPRWEVLRSLGAYGLLGLEDEMERRDALLDLIGSLPGTLTLDYHNLGYPEGSEKLWEFCLGKPFDEPGWRQINAVNIQVNMEERLAQLRRNYGQIEILKLETIAQQKDLAPCAILH